MNLSFIPFSYYQKPAASYGFNATVNGVQYPSCPPNVTVQGCFQQILGQLQTQSVTGIRIFVTFCDASSLAFTNDGVNSTCGYPYTSVSWNPSENPSEAAWLSNVAAFFQDVANAGIPNVTITTGASAGPPPGIGVLDLPWTQVNSPNNYQPCGYPNGNCCADTPTTVYFNPMIPVGLQSNGTLIGDYWATSSNQGYNCAPSNPFFIGWSNYFNVIGSILGKAKAAACPQAGHPNCTPLTVYELEIQEEVNTAAFTALARYFYDNSLPQSAPSQYVETIGGVQYANVLAGLRDLMSANSSDPGRVAYSALWSDATTATWNCKDAYGDYARNIGLDTVMEVMKGGPLGVPPGFAGTDGLLCGGTLSVGTSGDLMYQPPMYTTQPDIVDVHVYPSVVGVSNTDGMITSAAGIDYGDISSFLTWAGLTSASVVIGETYGGAISPLNQGTAGSPNYCWGTNSNTDPLPSGAPTDNVKGFNNEGVSNPLSNHTVTFRPWMELEDPSGVCFAYGSGPGTPGNYQTVNYQGNGPYTPTNK